MAKIFFIADLHLSINNTERNSLTISFLDMVIREKGDLYILGDFFDFWANNRKILQYNLRVLNKLKELTSHGLKTGFIFGNRDFLISQKALSPFGIDFLGEEAEITLDTKRVFLTHGHTLCTSDVKFMRYKQTIWPFFRFFDRIVPGVTENYIARKCILRSKKAILSQDESNLQFSVELMRDYFNAGIDVIICGHAHRMEQQFFGEHCFYALPCWKDGKGNYLLYNGGEFILREFSDSDLSPAV